MAYVTYKQKIRLESMAKKNWVFRLLQGDGFQGPNSGSGDHFKGTKLSSLVRELVQNSMDANNGTNKPVRIVIDLKKVSVSEFPGFKEIWPHIEACHEYQANLGKTNNIWQLRYKKSIDEFKEKKDVNILCFHDAETNGLTGPIDGTPTGAFNGVKGEGLTWKQGQGAGGSFGHGASAALLYSGIGSVFYYTKVEEKPTERFIGKISLQSHEHPNGNGLTRAIGYYANDNDEITPLTNDEIPLWAKQFRKDANLDIGCSAYVPYTFFDESLFPETIISLIANFYVAIQEGKLEASIGGREINSENLEKTYLKHKELFVKGQEVDDLDVKSITECFESIDTYRKPDHQGTQEVPGFGKIDWYLRLTEEIKSKKVGISRKIGMLITRQPLQLIRFVSHKYFDMFVCVKGPIGNDVLQKLENPQHDKFEKDRIDDIPKKEREQIWKTYTNFTNKIRSLLDRYAKSTTSDEVVVDEVAELFGETEETSGNAYSDERGKKILISDHSLVAGSAKPRSFSERSKGESGKGSGQRGGKGKQRKRGGSKKGSSDSVIVSKKGTKNTYSKGKRIKLQNLRIGNTSTDGKSFTLYFDPLNIGSYVLSLSKKGEDGSYDLDFSNGKTIQIDVKSKERSALNLTVCEDVREFVLEGDAREIKN